MKSRLSPAVQLSSCRVLSAASRAPLARAAQRTCGAHRTSGRAAGLLSCCRKYRRCIVLKSRCRSYSMSSTFISCARIYLNCFFLIVWTITLRQKYASVWLPTEAYFSSEKPSKEIQPKPMALPYCLALPYNLYDWCKQTFSRFTVENKWTLEKVSHKKAIEKLEYRLVLMLLLWVVPEMSTQGKGFPASMTL